MAPESLLLPGHVALAAVIVEAGLADGHHAFVFCQINKIVHRRVAPFPFVRMHADGGEYVRMFKGDLMDLGKSFQRDRHAQHVSDPVVPGALEYSFQAGV